MTLQSSAEEINSQVKCKLEAQMFALQQFWKGEWSRVLKVFSVIKKCWEILKSKKLWIFKGLICFSFSAVSWVPSVKTKMSNSWANPANHFICIWPTCAKTRFQHNSFDSDIQKWNKARALGSSFLVNFHWKASQRILRFPFFPQQEGKQI